MNNENNLITFMTQKFYGNRTICSVAPEYIDDFIYNGAIGTLSNGDPYPEYRKDRTIVKVPNTSNIVIVYNKFGSEESYTSDVSIGYKPRPSAVIPEIGLEIYGRCIVCRQDKDGNLCSILEEDLPKFIDYLAE